MLKKLAPLAQCLSQQLVFFVHQAHDSVEQKSQQVQTEQQGRQELCSLSEIVFEMIAFGLEDIVVFIFDFPACASVARNRFDGCLPCFKICDKGIFVNEFPRLFMSDGQLHPVD